MAVINIKEVLNKCFNGKYLPVEGLTARTRFVVNSEQPRTSVLIIQQPSAWVITIAYFRTPYIRLRWIPHRPNRNII